MKTLIAVPSQASPSQRRVSPPRSQAPTTASWCTAISAPPTQVIKPAALWHHPTSKRQEQTHEDPHRSSPRKPRVATTGVTASFAGPDNGIMVHGYLGTAYGK